MDIPLDDPTANKAATKIQAGFRGHMTRKKMKDDKPREEVSKSTLTGSGGLENNVPPKHACVHTFPDHKQEPERSFPQGFVTCGFITPPPQMLCF